MLRGGRPWADVVLPGRGADRGEHLGGRWFGGLVALRQLEADELAGAAGVQSAREVGALQLGVGGEQGVDAVSWRIWRMRAGSAGIG